MHHLFQTFVDHLSEAMAPDDLRAAMVEAAAALDLSCFAYLRMPHKLDAEPRLISNYPSAWTTQYLQKHYERYDPVIIQAVARSDPFRWGFGAGSSGISKSQHELFEEAASFGIRYGFTIPIHDNRGPVAAITFAADQRLPQFERVIAKYGNVLQLMAIYFHAHARQKITDRRAIDGILLSPREFECLEWAAKGKSAWETGCILGISRHTVATYLDNAKAKLGVRTIVQAVTRLTTSRSTR